MIYLPPEIVDRIIDFLHDSHPDLSVCARVCKAWLESSRSHIFYSILIDPLNHPPFPRLCNVIQHSPSIAFYVHELHFSIGYFSLMSAKDSPSKWSLPLIHLLRSLTQLHKLEFHEVIWSFLPPDVRRSFRDILALPSLVHFETNFRTCFKLEDFTNLLQPHLRRLGVRFSLDEGLLSTVQDENVQNSVVERQPCRLDYLSFVHGTGFIDWLAGSQSVIDLSTLRTLHICFDDHNWPNLMKLIRSTGTSLEHLQMSVCCVRVWKDTSPDVIDLDCRLNLKTVSLFIDSGTDVRCLMRLFSHLAAPNLQEIAFLFWFPRQAIDVDALWGDLAQVDRVLGTQPLSLLRCVKVTLRMLGSDAHDAERHRQKFTRLFSSLVSRGIVEFEYSYM